MDISHMIDETNKIIRQKTPTKDLQASEIRYRRLFESARDGILILDAATRKITDANPFMVELLGYSRDEFLGKELWEIGLLKDEEASRAAFRELQQNGYIRYEGLPLETKAGARRELEFISNVYAEDDPQVIQCNIRDITERKRAEEALCESEERYRIVVENAADVIITIDQESTIVFVNESVERVFGYTVTELLGKPLTVLMPEYLRHLHDVGLGRYVQTGQKHLNWQSIELPGLHKSGREVPLELSFGEYKRDGKHLFTGIARDITKRKRAEDELIKLTGNLKLSVQEHQQVLDNSLDVICQVDEAGRFIQVSAAAKKMWGYEPEELIGRMYMELVHPDDRAKSAQAAIDIMSGQSTNIFENCYQRKDGSVAYMMWSANWSESDKTMFCVAHDVGRIRQTEEALKDSDANYRNLVESSHAIIYLLQPEPPYAPIYVSPNIVAFGYPVEHWFSQPDVWASIIHDEDRERVLRITRDITKSNLDTELEYRIVGRDGTIHWVQDKGRFVFDREGNKIGWQGVLLDITKTKQLEEQLRQAQKLESVGRLAGGIAHDFNNMLTAINGYSDLTLRRLKEDDPLRHNIEEIKKAGIRSAALTHQLLAFSRQQILQPKVLSLNRAITDTSDMLQRLIGEDVRLATVLHPKAGQVEVDPGQLSQIIINLAVNARDVMPQGGTLTIETANVFLDPDYARQHATVIPGAYVMMAVSDTGTGMTAETQEHIFEPFFTTKEVGKGTGLGLATVYGIVKQSGGNIMVYSEEGIGTTFKVYLPRVIQQSEAEDTRNTSDELPQGTETILLVEDEDVVRTLTRQILEMCGYTVLEAGNGVEAISLCEKHDCHIHLLMTDVVMPQMGGRELSERFAAIYPQMRILFTSGYTDDAVVRHGVIEAGTNFIQKPFTPDALAHKVRAILDGTKGS